MISRLVIKCKLGMNKTIGLILTLILLLTTGSVAAQEEAPSGAIYIVEQGDTLWDIAVRFSVSVDDLIDVNNLTDPGQLNAGDQLVIPGLEGVQGVLTTEPVAFGETILSLSTRHGISPELLAVLNHITSPIELYVGSSLVIPQKEVNSPFNDRAVLAHGQSIFELAIQNDANPWEFTAVNSLQGAWAGIPGEVLFLPGESSDNPGAFPPELTSMVISPTFPVQGRSAVLEIAAEGLQSISGTWMERELRFFRDTSNIFIALQGVHAMAQPGLYPITLQGILADGTSFHFMQSILIQEGDYVFDPVLTVDPATIDPQVTKPEDAQWAALSTPATADKYWNGRFTAPVDPIYADCWPSLFGSRRSYNESAYSYFHTGLDFCGGVGDSIYSPAPGVVVFAGLLSVRGNATMIDHGWGVYSGYMHQSEIFVKEGDVVEEGQLIGHIGGTGRVTGPHLHWEVFVGGVQVDPLDWLLIDYP
jgi:murein DD-endopeptidase MepM/ murein hydrolase activator NlpD